MADPVSYSDVAMLAGQHSDIRREAAEHTNEIVKEGLKSDYATGSAIKDTRYDINTRIGELSRENETRFFDIGRDTQDLRAQVISAQQAMVAGFLGAAKDSEINSLKTQIELAKQSTYISDKIDADGEKTRALINDTRYADLNRMLIERNAELVDERFGHRHWRGMWDSSQFQAISNRMQSLDSQFAETRQGMVNFGTMAGVGQTSTSNNVK